MGNYIGKVCPLCHADIMEGDAITVCSVCGVPHHESCWENNHGCANCECMKQQENVQHTIPVCACRNCGTLLEDDQMFCPRCGTPKDAVENKVCKKCGADLQEGQAFCVKCGQKVELIKEQNTASLLSQMNTVSKQSVKSMDVMIYSFICILGSVLLFVDGFLPIIGILN